MQYGGSCIGVAARQGECARSSFVDGGRSADGLPADGQTGRYIIDHSLGFDGLRQRECCCRRWCQEHIAIGSSIVVEGAACPRIVGLVAVNVYHIGLQRASRHSRLCRIAGIVAAVEGPQADGVLRTWVQTADGVTGGVSCRADHFAAVHLNSKPLFCVGVVAPRDGERRGRGLVECQGHRNAEEVVAIVNGNRVDIVLDVGIAIGGYGHGIVAIGVGAVGCFPGVRHTVAIGVSLFRAGIDGPCRGGAADERLFVGDQRTLLAVRHDFVHHVAVGRVAVG